LTGCHLLFRDGGHFKQSLLLVPSGTPGISGATPGELIQELPDRVSTPDPPSPTWLIELPQFAPAPQFQELDVADLQRKE